MGPAEVAIVGAGPGGLFLARLLRMQDPRVRVVVHERNPPDATFGFGVVFSERTLRSLHAADAETHDRIVAASQQWSDMELRVDGSVIRYGGFGFTAIARTTLLAILQEAAWGVGVELRFEHAVSLDDVAGAEVVVASDGVNSAIRDRLAPRLGVAREMGAAKYAWFGTTTRFDAVTFPFVETEHGRFAAHAYPYDDEHATFIVEVDEGTWCRAGMDAWTAEAAAPGASDLRSSAYLERAFAAHLDGAPLLVNNSKWASFGVLRVDRWHDGNVVLVGDAVHTAHFSVGSGTKLAMEDSIALAGALGSHARAADAFAAYERERRPAVERTQRWAAPSQRWWESFDRRRFDDPEQLAFHFITRTGAMSRRALRRRAPERVAAAEQGFLAATPGDQGSGSAAVAPAERDALAGAPAPRNALAAPLAIGGCVAPNRLALPLAVAGLAAPLTADVVAARTRSGAGIVLAPAAAVGVAAPRREAGDALLCAQVEADPAAVADAADAGADLIEVAGLGLGDADTAADAASLVAAAGGVPLLAAWPVLLVDPWQPEGTALVERAAALVAAGATGVRLVPDLAGPDREAGMRPHPALPGLALADRIRTETGALVALTVADGWGLAPPADDGDDWRTQAHMALVAGRVDLLATWPLPLGRPEGER